MFLVESREFEFELRIDKIRNVKDKRDIYIFFGVHLETHLNVTLNIST